MTIFQLGIVSGSWTMLTFLFRRDPRTIECLCALFQYAGVLEPKKQLSSQGYSAYLKLVLMTWCPKVHAVQLCSRQPIPPPPPHSSPYPISNFHTVAQQHTSVSMTTGLNRANLMHVLLVPLQCCRVQLFIRTSCVADRHSIIHYCSPNKTPSQNALRCLSLWCHCRARSSGGCDTHVTTKQRINSFPSCLTFRKTGSPLFFLKMHFLWLVHLKIFFISVQP